MNDRRTKQFIVRALRVAADSWEELARQAGMPEFEEQAKAARLQANILEVELESDAPMDERPITDR